MPHNWENKGVAWKDKYDGKLVYKWHCDKCDSQVNSAEPMDPDSRTMFVGTDDHMYSCDELVLREVVRS